MFSVAFCGVKRGQELWVCLGYLKGRLFFQLVKFRGVCSQLLFPSRIQGKGWFDKNTCKWAKLEKTKHLCMVSEELSLDLVSWWHCGDVRSVHLISWRWWHQPSWEASLQLFPTRALVCFSKSRFLWANDKSVVVEKMGQHKAISFLWETVASASALGPFSLSKLLDAHFARPARNTAPSVCNSRLASSLLVWMEYILLNDLSVKMDLLLRQHPSVDLREKKPKRLLWCIEALMNVTVYFPAWKANRVVQIVKAFQDISCSFSPWKAVTSFGNYILV